MQTYDLLIIGGGINGAAIARDAAGRGLSVCLVEAGDPGGATSWASSKLIHGGLRYLEHFAFGLVRESLAERKTLLRIAPHLTHPCLFVMPHSPALRPAWMMRMGLWLYDHLIADTGLPAAGRISFSQTPTENNPLKSNYTDGFSYYDVQVDDARLVILTLRDAQLRGADILVRHRFLSAHRHKDGKHEYWRAEISQGDTLRTLQARAIVNAAGPWVSETIRHIEDDHAGTSSARAGVQLVRGSHIVVPRCYTGDHAYTLQNDDGRVVFLLPFHEHWTLIGTTDIRTAHPSTTPEASAEEVQYLCQAASRYLTTPVTQDQIVWRFAGLRPLYDDGNADPSSVTRDYHLSLEGNASTAPLVSIYGGKLTTHRKLAETVLSQLRPWFAHLEQGWTARTPLPGGDGNLNEAGQQFFAKYAGLPEEITKGVWQRHGTLAYTLLAEVGHIDDMGQYFGGGLTDLEVTHFIRHEWAHELNDIIWRRSKAGLFMSSTQKSQLQTWLGHQTK